MQKAVEKFGLQAGRDEDTQDDGTQDNGTQEDRTQDEL